MRTRLIVALVAFTWGLTMVPATATADDKMPTKAEAESFCLKVAFSSKANPILGCIYAGKFDLGNPGEFYPTVKKLMGYDEKQLLSYNKKLNGLVRTYAWGSYDTELSIEYSKEDWMDPEKVSEDKVVEELLKEALRQDVIATDRFHTPHSWGQMCCKKPSKKVAKKKGKKKKKVTKKKGKKKKKKVAKKKKKKVAKKKGKKKKCAGTCKEVPPKSEKEANSGKPEDTTPVNPKPAGEPDLSPVSPKKS